jgi:hypothetical protein
MILNFEYGALGEGEFTASTYFNALALMQSVRAWLELTTSWVLSDCTSTRMTPYSHCLYSVFRYATFCGALYNEFIGIYQMEMIVGKNIGVQ